MEQNLEIKHDLLPKQKKHTLGLNATIELFPYAAELWKELDRIGIVSRLESVPQLGVIKVSKALKKSRYDYILLQLYLHNLILGNLKSDLQISYNNTISEGVFESEYKCQRGLKKPTVYDILQLLTFVYNIGHFYNTFTASRACIMAAIENTQFKKILLEASEDPRYKDAVEKIVNSRNYKRFHLLNSLIILEKCDQTKSSVLLSKEILYSYINENGYSDDKLKYIFSIFRNVRTVSYLAYDLHISKVPVLVDLCDSKAMILFLRELLSKYNNNSAAKEFVASIAKLLDDTIYNESVNAICCYRMSRKMANKMNNTKELLGKNYYSDYFIPKDSLVNRACVHNVDYVQNQILKLTFKSNECNVFEKLRAELERINNTRVGCYDRHNGEKTLLVSLKKKCDSNGKTVAAFKVLRRVVSILRTLQLSDPYDCRYLLCVKFFLFYLFHERQVAIQPTIQKEKCVICKRGKAARFSEITRIMTRHIGNDDQLHEVEFMRRCLSEDTINDTAICIPASILVYRESAVDGVLSEFDGMVIYPMRDTGQVLFLEAKNKKRNPSQGKNCLKEKLDKLSVAYNQDDIEIVQYDARLRYTI